jgi:hypothetical protein
MEKSKMELIKEYIESCPLLEGDKINVDYLDDEVYSYSIDRTPSNPVLKKFNDGTGGKYQITFDFTVTAPISSRVVTNLANSKFGEDFMEWIKTQQMRRNLPKINGAHSIECTSPSYILQKIETTAIYIIQMNFTYYELS